jgi:hypothetical protein
MKRGAPAQAEEVQTREIPKQNCRTVLRGRVQNGVVVLDADAAVPEGTVVTVMPV